MQVLRHLLNILPPSTAPDATIEAFLVSTELLSRQGKAGEITADGYEYMLKDHHDQVCEGENVPPSSSRSPSSCPSLRLPWWR